MKCPVCVAPDLMMADRQGIEIDYCPTCRGVWLDRGELDKIVERSTASDPHMETGSRRRQHHSDWINANSRDQFGRGREKRRERSSLLSDLFDFD